MNCPHCKKPISRSEIARAVATSGAKPSGPAKVMRPCKHCGELFGARALRQHVPHCPGR